MRIRRGQNGLMSRGSLLAVGLALLYPTTAMAQSADQPSVTAPSVMEPSAESPRAPSAPSQSNDQTGQGRLGPGIVPPPGGIEPLKLGMPVACTVGKTCWVVNFVDHDPSSGFRDYQCGPHGYNTHKGTDIALATYRDMVDGVSVQAAAAGTVVGMRDGMLDGDITLAGLETTGGRDCGNGVTLEHPGGWRTSYCHLKRGSIRVTLGQEVEQGQKMAEVGSSGRAQFPHLHLEVRYQGKHIIDPFRGLDADKKCGRGAKPLWDADVMRLLTTSPTALYAAGFARTKPNPIALRQGFYRDRTFRPTAPNMIFWVDSFWVKEGDELTLTITGPNGKVIASSNRTLKKTQARYFSFAGKRLGIDWKPGTYVGEAVLLRKPKKTGDKPETFRIERTLRVKG